jgi:hypothetical protein
MATPETPSLRSIMGQFTLRRSTSTTVNLGLYTLRGGSTAADIETRDVINEAIEAVDSVADQAFDGEVPNGNFWSAADIYRWYAAGGVGVGDLLLELGNNLADFQGLAITTTGDVNAAYVETVGDVYANGEVWGSYIESTGGLVSVSSLTSKLTIAAESTATFPMPVGSSATVSKVTAQTRTTTGTALTFAIGDLTAVKIISSVLARKAGAAYSADFEYVVRRDGGTVTEIKSVKSNESSAAGPVATFSISGTNVIITWTVVDASSWKIQIDSTVSELPD